MRLLTVAEVANLLNVSTAQVYRMVKRGVIPYVEIGGVYRFDPEALNKWIADGGSNGKDE